jgi:hypothetical protein
VIENGLVTLYVYERNGDDYTPYTGNDKNVTIDIIIFNDMSGPVLYPSAKTTITVSFTNGNATVACDPSSIVDLTFGTLTITGIPATYEGKRVQVDGHKGEFYFYACPRYEDEEPVIENGSVTLSMQYKVGEDGYSYTFYKGNDQDVPMEVLIYDGSSVEQFQRIAYAGITVSFTKGSATVACDPSSFVDSDDVSRLTITGIPATYNGKRVQVKGYIGELYLYAGITNWEGDQAIIADGSVTLYVDCDVGERNTLYKGNDNVSMEVVISAGSSLNVIASATIPVSFTVGHAIVDCPSSSFADLTSAGGRLTITGLSAYEGKRVRATGSIGELNLSAYITRDDGVEAIIKDGSVTLFVPCWASGNSQLTTLYTGNGNVPMSVLIFDAEPYRNIATADITVPFTNGCATVAVQASDITPY